MKMVSEDYIGTCQWCDGEFKVNANGLMVLHGYQRPGYGYTLGNCTGYRQPPFEYDHKLMEVRIADLKKHNSNMAAQIKKIDGGTLEKIPNPNFVPPNDPRRTPRWGGLDPYEGDYNSLFEFPRGHKHFDQTVRHLRARLVADIAWNENTIAYLTEKVKNWTRKDIPGLDTPPTGKKRYLRDPYDPDKLAARAEFEAAKAARDAKPGKITVNVYAIVPFESLDQSLPEDERERQWRARNEAFDAAENEFKAKVKAWAKGRFPEGKLWTGDGDRYEAERASGVKDFKDGKRILCLAFKPDWQYRDEVMAMFPNAHRCDKDGGRRDSATGHIIGKGKDIRLWVDVEAIPGL